MADSQIDTEVILKNSKILVTVEEVLQDILLVSYAIGSKLFQGVLLDSTKRFLPCRIPDSSANQISSPKNNEPSEEDKLFYSIRQRFTYFQEKPAILSHFHHPKKSKAKNQKMTVRLRPRQVLCSKCKSVCIENSENVNSFVNKNKKADPPDSSPRPLFSENRRDNHLPNSSPPTKLCPSFVQRIPRLAASPIHGNAVNGSLPTPVTRNEEVWLKPSDEQKVEFHSKVPEDETDKHMVLRKKRSVGSMEDLWDETVFEEGSKKAKTTPVIKISFGSQGEGTVLKIPSKVQLGSESETDDKQNALPVSKATRKALKKAKKEARKKTLTESPKRHVSPPPELPYKKHKHKVKHKKKHKTYKTEEEIKEKCVKQKLSINLRRLTPTTYEKAESSDSSVSSEEVPDFPETKPAIVEDYKDASTCKTLDGSTLAVGDIVWGKVQGFPWWPGKVLNILIRKDSESCWKANVAWYGSSTSSIMPCDQLSPFLATFKVRYNRRKKSAGYKEAIRLATTDASASNPAVTADLLCDS